MHPLSAPMDPDVLAVVDTLDPDEDLSEDDENAIRSRWLKRFGKLPACLERRDETRATDPDWRIDPQ